MCVLVTFKRRGLFVMLNVIRCMHLTNLHFWTYLNSDGMLVKLASGPLWSVLDIQRVRGCGSIVSSIYVHTWTRAKCMIIGIVQQKIV